MWHWPDWQSKCTFPGAKQGTELELNKEVYMYLQMGKVKRCGNESMTTFTPPPPISFFSPLRGKLCCNGLFMCVRGVCLHCMAVRDRFPIFLDGSLSQLGARWRWQSCRERENTPPSVCHLGTKRVPEIKPLEEQMWKRNTHNNIASFSTFVLFGQDWVITINHSICCHTHTPSLTQIHRKSDRHTGQIILAQRQEMDETGVCLCCGAMYTFQTKVWILSANTFSHCKNASSRRLTYMHAHTQGAACCQQ